MFSSTKMTNHVISVYSITYKYTLRFLVILEFKMVCLNLYFYQRFRNFGYVFRVIERKFQYILK